MIFTSLDFVIFFIVVLYCYWRLCRRWQNIFIVIASYFFYGYVHPAFCILLFTSTVSDYYLALAIEYRSHQKKLFLTCSIAVNLGILFFFKYFNFFVDNISAVLAMLGWNIGETTLRVFLPVGISFYTFQTLSYTIDVYRQKLQPTHSIIDFALYVCFFPQLVAGPIERAIRLLPQISKARMINITIVRYAIVLIVWGFCKKLVIADNVAVYVNQIFLLKDPSLVMLIVGSFAFSIQILADFSAYTDIARGCSYLLGFELMENFKRPYVAISPSDFWRRWHISLSSWIRDYLYIPLGGSKITHTGKFFAVVMITMILSGLWHGAAWTYVTWGAYHGLLVFIYHQFGIKGNWQVAGVKKIVAWALMYSFTLFGWLLFRAPSITWLTSVFVDLSWFDHTQFVAAVTIFLSVLLYTLPYACYFLLQFVKEDSLSYPLFLGIALCLIFVLGNESGQDFIYFRF
ncbi:MBOAT family O-acyltransferase [Candidatus Uabimicrobium amorphum]|uniref:Alginate O-acetyltransferase n=1 Tax=Uabimicrobium amorphum TaxID=2596890 RepID=A0A5S9IMR5_UABAM|nr:MBOAT family O-acyltransferase [Candidatus Uabimicrobium amorphum]BBM84719.1 alginate O-acetyltransferase [Candidatus Uabimicrobium amorphum]